MCSHCCGSCVRLLWFCNRFGFDLVGGGLVGFVWVLRVAGLLCFWVSGFVDLVYCLCLMLWIVSLWMFGLGAC